MDADVIIIGGGASGLFAGIMAGRRGRRVLILEQKDKVGKKILATGNGKCNYTNQNFNADCYRGEDPSFAGRALNGFSHLQTIEAFRRMGIEPKVKNGYYYPASGQAASVLEVLRQELVHNGVRIRTGEKVDGIHIRKDGFVVEAHSSGNITQSESRRKNGVGGRDGKRYKASSVILSTGGCAYPTLGSDGSGYELAEGLGHRIITPLPALTSLKVREKFLKSLAGVRVEARIRLYVDGQRVIEDVGELQIVKYGISGIPVFQISRHASKALAVGKKVCCLLDFLPHISKEELLRIMKYRLADNGYKTIEGFLVGFLHSKLAYVIVKEAGIPLTRIVSEVTKKEWDGLVKQLKGLRVTVTEPAGFDQAQVTAGGVCTDEMDPETMESKIVKNLYVTGELVDVDGICGGYNLQWAWTTGYLAGSKA